LIESRHGRPRLSGREEVGKFVMDRFLGQASGRLPLGVACALALVLWGCGDDSQPTPNGDGEDGGEMPNSPGRGGPMRPGVDASTPGGPAVHLRDSGAASEGGNAADGGQDEGGTAPDGGDPACTDQDPCTFDARDADGECTHDPVVCTAIDECHDPGVCNRDTGLCSNPRRSDGASCDDDDACTRTDRCVSGACVGTNPVICTAEDQCHDPGTCDSASGECSDVHKRDGTTCSDGDDCTDDDACVSGVCTATPPVISCDGTQCAPAWWLGDNDCDEGLLCAENTYDHGDCACGGNPAYVVGCDGTTCFPATDLGDGVCDTHLLCAEGNYDDGDCACGGDRFQVTACVGGACHPLDWLRDNFCDPELNCAATNFDDGDCPTTP